MDADHIHSAAKLLTELRLGGTTVDEPPADLRPKDLAAGYAIQDDLVVRLEKHYGGFPVGYKIACTNTFAQKLLNTSAPVLGRLSSCFVLPSPARIDSSEFAYLGIEVEFAFEISRDLPPDGVNHTAETITEYVAAVVPAIEFVGHRFSDWSQFDAPLLVADNAVHQAWIPASGVDDWRGLDLKSHQVQLIVNGDKKLSGSGENVLEDPLNALAWLANELPRWGRSLQAGEFVTTGTCTDVYTAQAGDKIRADLGALGSVELELA
jgi:2-keto-4-pentenoate hydratase